MFTITLLGVFALAAIFVAVMGASVYQSSAEKMQANFDTRTSLVYIAEKVRQSPQGGDGDIEVRQLNGHDALVLKETYDKRVFETWIFVKDGKLHEVMAEDGTDISDTDGQTIMALKSLEFDDNGRTLKITVVNSSDEQRSLTIGRRR
jgi:hypothetical protein